tara:strand:- start:395 stop:511 length:117 start_codon:yes stop_codon:yes gene_type:complete
MEIGILITNDRECDEACAALTANASNDETCGARKKAIA